MAGISFSGIGSTIDFSLITDSIINARSRPINLLTARKSDYQGRSDALKQLNAKLIALKDSVSALTDRTVGSGRVASSTDSAIVTATATSAAASNTLGIQVVRLATSLSEASRSYASTESAVLAGSATAAVFELRKGGAATGTPITIDSTNNSLAGLRDTINAAGVGITATIVDVSGDGTGNQLVLNSTETGAAGRIELVETTSTGTGADLNLRSLNPPGGSFADLDSQIKINGLTIARPTNTISDAVSGVTFSLKGAGTSSVTVSSDAGALKSKIAAFVDAFNAVQDFIATQLKPDANGKPTGILANDLTLRVAQQGLRSIVSATSGQNGGAFANLLQIGISRDDTGKLKIDQDTLNDKLKTSFSDVKALFAGSTENETGLATGLLAISDDLSDSALSAISGFKTSIERIDKSIADQQVRLAALRESLTRQFSIADAAIGQLNGQGTTLTGILKSLEPKSS